MVNRSKCIPLIFTILSLLSLILLLNTTPVHATGGVNGEYHDTVDGQKVDIEHPWSEQYKGYRISIVSESDKNVDKTVDMWFGNGTHEKVLRLTRPDPANGLQASSYLGATRESQESSKVNRIYDNAEDFLNESGKNEMPHPWYGFTSNGQQLETWIYTVEDGQEYSNGLRLIEKIWGKDVLEQYINDPNNEEFYIIIEGLSLFDMLNDDNERVGIFAGTAFNWSGRLSAWLHMPYGNVWLRRGTNGAFAISLQLEETWEGTNTWGQMDMPVRKSVGTNPNIETDFIEAEELRTYGYDVVVYRFSDVMNLSTHTWDYDLGETPGPAPKVDDIKRNKINIIKVYCSKDKESEEVISWDGSFLRKENPRSIQIEDEPEYTVEEWKTTKDKNPSPPSTWDPVEPRPHIQKGTSQGTVTLDPDKPTLEQTLYVLLVKYEEVDNEKDLILHESEISRYYELRDVKEFKGIDRRIQWTMNQISLGPCTYSPIHSDHGSYTDSEGNSHTIPCNCICNNRQVVITESHLTFKVKNVLL